MKRYQNLVLILLVVVIGAFPLWYVNKPGPGPDGKQVEIFKGADDKAKEAISEIAPDYKPWFNSIMEPSSGEVASLLFAMQAAIGAGFLGYWLGSSTTRARIRKEQEKAKA
jgi:cobalt/nickel transport protein